MKKIELLFDCIRSPYDIAHIIQLAISLDATIYTCGNSIPFDIKKIKQKVKSWNITSEAKIIHFETFEEAVNELKKEGKILIGTSGNVEKSYYDVDKTDIEPVMVFGTETSGLTTKKQAMLDYVVKLPMSEKVDFLTLPVVTSAIAYDLYREINYQNVKTNSRSR